MQDQATLAATVGDTIRYMGTGGDQLVRLAEFLEKLRKDPRWSEADIMTVRSRVNVIRKQFKSE